MECCEGPARPDTVRAKRTTAQKAVDNRSGWYLTSTKRGGAMRYFRSPFLSALLAVSLLLPSVPVIAADHADSPNAGFDRAADIADIFAFVDPVDPSQVVLILTFAGFIVPGENNNFGTLDPNVRYRFLIENTGDATPDGFIDVQFDPRTPPDSPDGHDHAARRPRGPSPGDQSLQHGGDRARAHDHDGRRDGRDLLCRPRGRPVLLRHPRIFPIHRLGQRRKPGRDRLRARPRLRSPATTCRRSPCAFPPCCFAAPRAT